MSTDYLEFKEHLEHAFTQKDKAEYYRKQSMNNIQNAYDDIYLAGKVNNIKKLITEYDRLNDQLNGIYRDMDRSHVPTSVTNNQNASSLNGRRDKLENQLLKLKDQINAKYDDLLSVLGAKKLAGYKIPWNREVMSHDSLEHGWFSDLFKKTTNAKGSTAGMPSNIPVNQGGSAVAAMNSYTDQLTRLTNSLYQYELQMKQYKEAYDQVKTAYANTKKEISRIEKLREEAIKNAKYPITDTSASKLKENKDANFRYLAGKTTGSKAGMPNNLRRK